MYRITTLKWLMLQINLRFGKKLKEFIDDKENNIGVLEFSKLSNTDETLELTKFLFKVLFD